MPARRKRTDRWQVVVYETDRSARPAIDYLEEIPVAVHRELLTTVVAVTEMGPPRFPTSTPRWRLMHREKGKGAVDMSGVFEARDKQAKVLYRLFCVIDRAAPEYGLAAPSLVLLGGSIKADRTVVKASEYRKIRLYRDDYWKSRRIARDIDRSAFAPTF